ncbi:hypothetical protein BBN63_16945 [Streptomyces niveus]|uniref:Uncharacterized protein n=1 Tax=Streptomyces niveus TaxID=193462 RepID=A0A1U9QUD0_STRNV|nr:hypothetical protein BBN63_16945 [Streptomyces niveus]
MKRYAAVATDGAATRLMSGTPPLSAACPIPGRSAKTVAAPVTSVIQNLIQTQWCRASPQGVPRESTSPLTSVITTTGASSQSAKTFIAR